MSMENYLTVGISVLLLISLGVQVMPDHTHYCSNLNVSMECDRISASGKTCYPTEGTTKGKKYCSSTWENIVFDIDNEPSKESNPTTEAYECHPEPRGCELKR